MNAKLVEWKSSDGFPLEMQLLITGATGKINCQSEASVFIKTKQCVVLLSFNQSEEAGGRACCSLVGWLRLFQLQMMTRQNSNLKTNEITIYFGKQHLHEYGNVDSRNRYL